MKISHTIIAGCLLTMFICILMWVGNNPPKYIKQPFPDTHLDSIKQVFKAGYLLGADRQKDSFDVTSIWQLDSTLFFDKYIKK